MVEFSLPSYAVISKVKSDRKVMYGQKKISGTKGLLYFDLVSGYEKKVIGLQPYMQIFALE